MKADNTSLLEFIGGSKRTFYIPVYQRNYDWKHEQCQALFKDIEDIAIDKEQEIHFMGTIVYIDSGSNATFRSFTIIDGQQRLTTIMILLKALADVVNDERIKSDIIESYLTNRNCPNESLRIKLKPMKSDSLNYERLIDGQINNMESTQILDNYRFFLELIDSSSLSPDKIYEGIQKLEIVYIQLNQDKENPQLIFESLNSTGLDLTQADLIRNFLLMGQDYLSQELLYNKYWLKLEKLLPDLMISDYIRDYLTLKTGVISNKDTVYSNFKKYCKKLVNFDSEGFLDELLTYGEYYSWFKLCNSPHDNINIRLTTLQKLKSTTVYPFLLSLFEDCFMYQNITIDDICNTIDLLISYVIRRLLCEMPTNSLNKVFASMTNDIEKYHNMSMYEKVAQVLSLKKGKAAFPNDKELRTKILMRDIFKFPHVKFVLEQIERIQGKEIVDFDNLTIEHIMPQTLTPKWRIDLGKNYQETYDKYVNCLGNLTLTGYNSELSNKSFDEKKELYKSSNVNITKAISSFSCWGEKQILERSQYLIDALIGIWKCPDIINNPKSEIDTRTEFDFTDDIDVTGRTPVEINICGTTKSVNSWSSFLEVVCTIMYDFEPNIFRSLVNHSDFKNTSRRIICETPDELRRSFKIADNLYIEKNLPANKVLNYCKLIVEKFDADLESECSFKLKSMPSV